MTLTDMALSLDDSFVVVNGGDDFDLLQGEFAESQFGDILSEDTAIAFDVIFTLRKVNSLLK